MSVENPPAFPLVPRFGETQPGMTLRDYFAGQVLSGAMAEPTFWQGKLPEGLGNTSDAVASRAYRIADAMLSARQENRHG